MPRNAPTSTRCWASVRTKQTHKLQPWELQAIADAYAGGEKVEAVAAEFGVTPGRVCQIAQKNGHPCRQPRKVLEPQKSEVGLSCS